MIRRGQASLKMWLLGAAAVGIPTALGMFVPDQVALADGKLSFGTATKKPTVKVSTAVATEPPRLLPVPDTNPQAIQTVSDFQTVAATGPGQKSEVMKQLELLYEKDGREMPELQTMQPVPTGGIPAESTASPKTDAGPVRAAQPRTQAIPSKTEPSNPTKPNGPRVLPSTANTPDAAPSSPSKNPITGFFKKLMPGNKESKTTATPPAVQPHMPPVGKTPAVRSYEYKPAQILSGQRPVQSGNSADSTAQRPASPGKPVPLLPQQPERQMERTTPAFSNDETLPVASFGAIPPSPIDPFDEELAGPDVPSPAPLPPLLTQPLLISPQPLSADSSSDEVALPGPTSNSNLETPFSTMSEEEADEKRSANPFTGLVLKDEPEASTTSVAEKASGPKAATPPGTDSAEDPFAEELRKLGILPPLAAKPATSAAVPKPTSPELNTPGLDGIEDDVTRDKMLKIRERGGMKGLKGFCPVTLHDQRELIDAKAEFHATYRGQKFHFATAEAKAKFDDDPTIYAPAAYGADVVALTRDKDVVEGSLDHAAWFKSRLYLFGTQDAHDTFVSNPVQYATPAGIE